MKQQIKNKSVATGFQKFLKDFAPPGVDTGRELRGFLTGLMVAGVISLSFLTRFSRAKEQLYHMQGSKQVLKEGAVMTDFSLILGGSLNCFGFLCVLLLGVLVWHYLYYWQGSKSIYLMKRLPNGMEIHKRAWTLPLLAIAITLVTAFALLLLYYEIYMIATPEQCITPGQWQNIWR